MRRASAAIARSAEEKGTRERDKCPTKAPALVAVTTRDGSPEPAVIVHTPIARRGQYDGPELCIGDSGATRTTPCWNDRTCWSW